MDGWIDKQEVERRRKEEKKEGGEGGYRLFRDRTRTRLDNVEVVVSWLKEEGLAVPFANSGSQGRGATLRLCMRVCYACVLWV